MKLCKKCGIQKPLDDFHKQKDCKDGRRPSCKDCHNAEQKAHRDANIEVIRERDRKRYAVDPERRERQRATARAHNAANREKKNADQRARHAANPERAAMHAAKRKALKRAVEHQPYTRTEIYTRDGGRCRNCQVGLFNGPNGFHIDHIVPLSLGGPDIPANLQLMCGPCNRSKWANLEGQIHLPV